MEKTYDYDVAIIGSGPAGVTAAIYAKRANLNCVVIEKEIPGGEVNKTASIENYPGYKEISGPDLAQKFYDQLKNLNIKIIFSEVIDIDTKQKECITLKNGKKISTKSIILAVGRKPKKLKSENYNRLEGKGISYCALCDANLFKDEDVSIVGAGNSALEESLYLSKICKSVTIINKDDHLKGDKIVINNIEKEKNIKVMYNSTIKEFNDYENNGVLDSLTIIENGQEKELKTRACFIFIGYEPATDFLKKLEILDEKGYINVDGDLRTDIKGIYAAGDAVKKDAFQIVTATSDGARAAITCIKDLKSLKEE